MDLQARIRDAIYKYGMLSKGSAVLVAVSGGPDSVALLHLLAGHADEFSLRLEVAHLQHGIRGEEAQEDALFVARMAEKLALPFHLRSADLPGMRRLRGKGNLEAMGREERYRFFSELAAERGIDRVATGHTRDDQVETLLMWLLRGSGRKGLGGMAPVQELALAIRGQGSGGGEPKPDPRSLNVIRPLIEIPRKAILGYLAAKGLEYKMDRTNLETGLLRNWIRLDLLPRLREKIDTRLDERLAHLADLLRDEEEFLDATALDRLGQLASGGELKVGALLREPKAMQRKLMRLWLEERQGSLRGLGFHHVDEALSFIAGGPPQGFLSLPRGWNLVKEYETIRLEKRERKRARPICYSYLLPPEGELVIPEAGLKMRISRNSFRPDERPGDDREALFDLALLPESLVVRNFRPGDRFQPLGMTGHKKVKDLFIEKKVPSSVRATLPLLSAANEILWIPGYGRSERAKIGPETKEVLKLRLQGYEEVSGALEC